MGPLLGGERGASKRSYRLGADEVAGGQVVAALDRRRGGGRRRNQAQAGDLVVASRTITSSQRFDGDTETFVTTADADGAGASSGPAGRLDDLVPDGARDAAIGDAVTVPVAEWIGRRIIECERRLNLVQS